MQMGLGLGVRVRGMIRCGVGCGVRCEVRVVEGGVALGGPKEGREVDESVYECVLGVYKWAWHNEMRGGVKRRQEWRGVV